MFTCEHPEADSPPERQEDDSFSEEVSFLDEHPITPRREYPALQKAQMKVYQGLRAKCLHAGCIRVETLRHLDSHQKSCKFNPENIAVLNKKHCGEACEFDNDLSHHLHVKTCPLHPKKCNSCGQSGIHQKDFEEHSCIKYLLELKALLEQKNTICLEEAAVLDENELAIQEQFQEDNNAALAQHKALVKENKNIRANVTSIQSQFQKEMAKLESSVIPRMRIFQENSQERVVCFENRQADSLMDFTKQSLYFDGQLHKDIRREVNSY